MRRAVMAVAGVLLVTSLMSLPAHAEADKAAVAKLKSLLAGGKAAEAAALLAENDLAGSLASEPKTVRAVCNAAAQSAQALGKADGAKAAAVAAGLVAAATQAVAAHTDDVDCCWALAYAHLARGRASRAAGRETTAEDWAAAVDALTKNASVKKDGGSACEGALKFLLDAPVADKRSSALVLNRLSAISAIAVDYHADKRDLLFSFARTNFHFAGDPAFGKKADMKALLKNCFACLRPFTAKPDKDVANLHYDAVTMQLDNKIVLKERYLTKNEAVLSGNIEFELPISRFWAMRSGNRSRRVCQLDKDGGLLRSIEFDKFSFAMRYVFADGTVVGGDNVKNLTRYSMEQVGKILPREEKRSKPKKGKLNKKVLGYTAEMQGQDARDKPVRLRFYLFRGKRQMTYQLLMIDYVTDEEFGPPMEAFLATIRESK